VRGAGAGRGGREGRDADHELPVGHAQELALEEVELGDGDAADLGVVRVRAERVAEALARDRDRGDDEAVAGERGEREEGRARADPVHVVQREEEA
jgi:hypothetical protein